MRQILVVDDNLSAYQAIQDRLQNDITEIICISSPVEALASYIQQDYCLVILDTQLSNRNPAEMIRAMRSSKYTPILVLTNPLRPEIIVELLNAGADSYLEKPLNTDTCVAQVNALIKRYIEEDINHNEHKPIIYGSEFMISPRYRQVIIDGKPLTLTRKEFDLLHCLARYPRQVFTCEQLYNHVWGGDATFAVDNAVKSQIKRLRKKLSQIGKNYIRNEWGVGYKFVLSDC